MSLDAESLLNKARNCLDLEIAAIRATRDHLGASFVAVIEAIHDTILAGKKLILTGVGKNAPICQKLAGTFCSTGVPACFLDPNQALHGDLGVCAEGDLVFILSNSGQSGEILSLFPILKRLGAQTVAMTAQGESDLAANSDLVLTYQVEKEACPLNLAPTASTAAALALGDALAMVYIGVRGFGREDFARFHPSGSLGKSLLLKAGEIMRAGQRFAHLPKTVPVNEAIVAITQAKCGTIALTNPQTGILEGVFSDGDLRRCSIGGKDFLYQPVEDFMTKTPKTIEVEALAVDVLKIFENSNINDLIVVDGQGKPVGLIDGQDLPKMKIV